MAQIRDGLASVTNGSAVVNFTGVVLTGNAQPGNLFSIGTEGVWYEILTVNSATQVTLTSPYGGASAANVAYVIHQTFTDALKLPYPGYGDKAVGALLQKAFMSLDGALAALGTTNDIVWASAADTITLRKGVTADPTIPSGLIVKRGSLPDAKIVFRDDLVTPYWDFGTAPVNFGSLLVGGAPLTAANIPNTPAGTIAATTIQAAINELDNEKATRLLETTVGRFARFTNTTGAMGQSLMSEDEAGNIVTPGNFDVARPNGGGVVRIAVTNQSGASGSAADIRLGTWGTNSTYTLALGTGGPNSWIQEYGGAGTTEKYSDFNTHIFRNNSGGEQAFLSSGALRLQGELNASNRVMIRGNAGSYRIADFSTGTTSPVARWHMGATDDAESGSDNGSNFFIHRFADNGSFLSRPFEINRRYGYVRTPDRPYIVLLGYGSGAVTLAPNDFLMWSAYVYQAENYNMTWDGANGRVTVIAPGRYLVSVELVILVDGTYPVAALDLNVNGAFVQQPMYSSNYLNEKKIHENIVNLSSGDYITLTVPNWLTNGLRVSDRAAYALSVRMYHLG